MNLTQAFMLRNLCLINPMTHLEHKFAEDGSLLRSELYPLDLESAQCTAGTS